MKARRHLFSRRFWVTGVVLVLAGGGAGSGQAQVPDAPVRGFTFPILDPETLRMKARVRGEMAQPLGSDRVSVEGVSLESYGDGDRTNLVVLTERCLLFVKERRVESEESLRVASGNGQLELTGRGFTWDETNGLVITRSVQARLQRPGAEEEAGPQTGEPLQIESGRFSYFEGAAVFAERVQLTEAEDRLLCDVLRLQLHLAPGELTPSAGDTNLAAQVESVHAEGAVEVTASELVAQADRADYVMAAEQLRLSGGAQWRSGSREGRADTILLDRARDRLWAEGGVWMSVPSKALTAASPFGSPEPGAEEVPAQLEVRSATLEVVPDPEYSGLNRAVFQDRVSLVQGSNTVECEHLVVRYAEGASGASPPGPSSGGAGEELHLSEARAEGGVIFRQQTNTVTGAQAVYTTESGVLEVVGPVAWELEGKQGRSDRLRLNPMAGTAEALGHVQLRLPAESVGPVSRALGAPRATAPAETGRPDDAEAGVSSPVEVLCEVLVYREAGRGRDYGVADFSGGVRVTSGPDLSLRSQRMLAEIEAGTNALRRLVATQDVVIEAQDTRGRRQARGDRAEYVAREDRLWLTGDDGVSMDFEDQDGVHRGRGRLAVYESGSGVLELRTDAVLDSVHGHLTGEVVRVDRERQVLSAVGMWKMVIPVKGVGEGLSALEEGQKQP